MVAEAKAKELEEKKQEAEYEKARRRAEEPVRKASIHSRIRKKSAVSRQAAPMMMMKSAMAAPALNAPVAAAAPAPAPVPPSESAPEVADAPEEPAKEPGVGEDDGFVDESADIDYTQVPAKLDGMFEKYDKEGGVRPTTIKPSAVWRKKFQKALLAQPSEKSLGKDDLRSEKNKAFDLLDALSKSGALAFENVQLHIVILHTHCFDKTLLHTVTRDNVNPIEKVERTQLIIASIVHGAKPADMIRENQRARLGDFNADVLAIGDDEE
eukprot:TRINITY_DN1469_c0_g1_i1.p1 TRINITY_DN1469_c0_g1~~TRINITY_DN1469_c0_g1_i1.p1  ORF type:complete len:268 (+),score=105.65 TRINITY_DN1469_c0_g1_i1:166-969(+)